MAIQAMMLRNHIVDGAGRSMILPSVPEEEMMMMPASS